MPHLLEQESGGEGDSDGNHGGSTPNATAQRGDLEEHYRIVLRGSSRGS